jgi:hypothetical protein
MKVPKTWWPQDALMAALSVLAEYPRVEKIFLPGNHDGIGGEWGSGLRVFSNLGTIVEAPRVLDIHGISVAFWPYGSSRMDELTLFLRHCKKMNVKILVAHVFLLGVQLGAAELRLPGLGISPEDFGIGKEFTLGLFGDIHKGQRWSTGSRWHAYEKAGTIRTPAPWRGEAFYPGSPYCQSWGEWADPPKGWLIVDLESGRVDLEESNAPVFREYTSVKRALGTVPKDDMIVRFSLPYLDPNEREGIERRLREHFTTARIVQTVWGEPPERTSRTSMNPGMSISELMSMYVKARELESVSGKTLLEAGRRLVHR